MSCAKLVNLVVLGRAGAIITLLLGLAAASCEPGSFQEETRIGGVRPPGLTPPPALPPPPPATPTPPPATPVPPPAMPPPAPLPPGTLPPIPVPPPGSLPPGTLPPIPVPPPGTAPPIPVPPGEPENPVGSRQPPRVALLVVGNVDNPDVGDEALFTVLEGKGFFVLQLDDSATPDPAETGLVVITPSVTSNMIRNKYATLPAPVLVMDFGIFDDMGMTGAGENMAFGTTAGRQVTMEAAQASHPLAAGRTGTVSVSAANAPLNWGVPGPGAVVVATVPGAPQRAAIFGYPKGAAMQGGQMAPGKRVGFFASDMLTSRLSADGTELLEAAIEWAFAP